MSSTSFFPVTGGANPALVQLALVIIAVMFVGVSYFAWRRGVRSRSDSIWNLPALLFVAGFFYVLLTVLPSSQGLSLPEFGIANYPGWLSYLPLAVIVVAGGMSLIWALHRYGTTFTSPVRLASEESRDVAVSGALQRAISSLQVGNDARLAIIQCYRSMEEILQEGGVANSPSMTAREFEAASQRLFRVKRDPIHRLTNLFERARYSNEEVGTRQASEAEAVISELKEEVDRAMIVK